MKTPPWDDVNDGLNWTLFHYPSGVVGMAHVGGKCPKCGKSVNDATGTDYAEGQAMYCPCGTAIEYAKYIRMNSNPAMRGLIRALNLR